jgi:VCBS repeat protein
MSWRFLLPLAPLALAAASTPESVDGGTPVPYATQPDLQSAPMGLYETGLALADINRDGYPDLITASGNDQGLQPLAVYLNTRKDNFFNATQRPDWVSADSDAHMNLAVGDINGDGWLDVAVSTLAPPLGSGGVKVYFNRRGTLEKSPSFRSKDLYNSFACALGDANGDGRLDLATSDMSPLAGGSARIYFNQGGSLSSRPGWRSKPGGFGGGILFTDVQQDGFLDLVVGTPQVMVFLGSAGADGGISLPTTPGWSSREGDLVPYLSAGPVGTQGTWTLVVSRNNVQEFMSGDAGTPPRYEAYVPAPDAGQPVWTSTPINLGSGVKLADVNGDGLTDLLGGSWGGITPESGFFQVYLGQGGAFANRPALTSAPSTRGIIQSLDAADLRQRFTCPGSWSTTLTRSQAVVTLPLPLLGGISRVTRNGRALLPREYTTVPGAPWISFARRLAPGDQLQVTYTHPLSVDVVMANQDCQLGDSIYSSYATVPGCGTPSKD